MFHWRRGVALLAMAAISLPAVAQFRDDFDALAADPSGRTGWRSRTGDGKAVIDFRQGGKGYASIFVDATADTENVWWALIQREVRRLDLTNPDHEVRIEARIRVSHAPRRVNLQVQTGRTTDYHSHLMEYEIPDADKWHTISYTTRDFDARPGDTLIAHMALMDWGLSKYRVDVDYVKLDVVDPATAPPDVGEAIPYHPPIADPASFAHAIRAVPVGNELRWDLGVLGGLSVRGGGLLELTTRSVTGSGLLRVVEIIDGAHHPQPIIDWPPAGLRGGKIWLTIPRPVLQRLIDGRTEGLALTPLGNLKASFHEAVLRLNAVGPAGDLQLDRRFVCCGVTCSTGGIGLSGAAVAISRLERSVVPSNIHPPSLQREAVSIDFPSRTRSAFAVASRSAR